MTNKEFAKLLYAYMKPYKWRYIFLLIAMTYTGLYISLQPYLIKIIIDKTLYFKDDDVLRHVTPFIIYYIISNVIYSGAWQVKHIVERSVIPYLETDVAMHVFKHLQKQSYRYFQDQMPGSLSNRIADLQSGIDRIVGILTHFFRMFVGVAATLILTARVHIYFSIVLFVWILIFMIVTVRITSKLDIYTMNRARTRSLLFGRIVDNLTNILTIRLFARQDYEVQKQYETFNLYINEDRLLRYQQIMVWLFLGGFATLLLGVMLFLLVYGASHHWVVASDFAFIMLTAISLIENMFFIMQLISEFVNRWGTAKEGADIMNDPLEMQDLKNTKPLLIYRGTIDFRNVTFSYNKKPVLNNLSVKIFGGEKIGLVGFSGGGKTTFINLICRLFDPENGGIYIDETNIKEVSQNSLREAIAYIPQDPILFHRNIMENIRYGKLTAAEEEVMAAAKMAHCEDFIQKMPEGYNTIVGERGLKLSGGQRQRIAIARAYLKNAPILIMDEATSALDSSTEQAIQESMRGLMEGKTVIIVAHRLSTLMSMDRILVFNKGVVIEEGSHQSLIDQNGMYAKLWATQSNGFIGGRKR